MSDMKQLEQKLAEQIRLREKAEAALVGGRVQAEENLEYTRSDLAQQILDWQHLHVMSIELLQATDLQQQLSVLLKAVTVFHQSSQGVISLYDNLAVSLVMQASVGISASGLAQLACQAIGDGTCGLAFQERQRVVIQDTECDPRFAPYRKFSREQAVRAVCSIPFFNNTGSPIGVLTVYFSSPRQPTERELRLADICCGQIAAFVARAQVEAELHRERNRSHHILENMSDGFVLLDPAYRIRKINAAALKIDGRMAEQLIGLTYWDAWPGLVALPFGVNLKKVMQERQSVQVLQCLPFLDRDLRLEISATPTEDGVALIWHDITARRHAEQVLHASSTRIHQLANTIPQLAWMAHPDGWIHWYNQRWYAYTGASPAEMEGWGWQSVHDPDVLPLVMEKWPHSIATGEPFQMTFPLRGADGKYRPFLTLVSPLRDEAGKIIQWFGTNTDVSDLQAAEQALRDSEERLQEGLQAARMLVWEWDLKTQKVQMSANAQAILGRVWDDLAVGWDNVHPDDVQNLASAVALAIKERGVLQAQVRMLHPNSDIIWVDLRGKVVCDAQGEPGVIRGICVDVTERTHAVEKLKQADQRKDDFLAMLAHELRNPLAPISTAAHILKLPGLDEKRIRQTGEIISRQVSHMTSLVDDLLDVSRVTRGLVSLNMEDIDFKPLVQVAIEQVRSLIETRQHNLTVSMTAHAVFVRGDRTRLVQIMANLLNNAAKYTPQGGEISLSIELIQHQLFLSVRDNGIGIDASLLPHVFDLFAQGARTPDRAQGGLGVGLALVKSLAALHRGWVKSESGGPGLGSIFTVVLPLLQDKVEAQVSRGHPPLSLPETKALRLMLVDDNVDAASTLQAFLSAQGHEVGIRHDGKSALAESRNAPPQAFILDIGLPDMDGYELARQLKSRPETAHAVLIALTGYGQEHDRILSQSAGFHHHLVKPVDTIVLSKILALINH